MARNGKLQIAAYLGLLQATWFAALLMVDPSLRNLDPRAPSTLHNTIRVRKGKVQLAAQFGLYRQGGWMLC